VEHAWDSHKLAANSLKMRWVSHYSRVSGKPTPSGLDFKIYRTHAAVPAQAWKDCNPDQDVFLSADYLTALEQAPPANLQFRYVVFSDRNRSVAIGYFQILELNPSLHGSLDASWRRQKKTHLEKIHLRIVGGISHRVLICGNALLSGEHGYAFNGVPEAQVLHALAEAAYALRGQTDEPILVNLIKDFYDGNHRPTGLFSRFGYYAFDAGPNLALALRGHWVVFDDYLKQMKAKYRKQAVQAIKKGALLRRSSLGLNELIQHKDALYRLYGNVVDKSKFKLFFLSPDYFSALKRCLGERFVCEAYFEGQDLIGFTTRIFNGAEMEGYTHGLNYERNKQFELYQNFMLDDIRAALAAKCRRINTGRTSAAMKSSLGAEPHGMTCYLRFSGKVTNQFLKPLFYFIKPAEEYCRHPFEDEPGNTANKTSGAL
jgi:hypothetical protein